MELSRLKLSSSFYICGNIASWHLFHLLLLLITNMAWFSETFTLLYHLLNTVSLANTSINRWQLKRKLPEWLCEELCELHLQWNNHNWGKLLKQHLQLFKSRLIVLRTHRKWRYIYSRKSPNSQNTKQPVSFNTGSISSPSIQFNTKRNSTTKGATENRGLPLYPDPSQGWSFFLEVAGHQDLSHTPSSVLKEIYSRQEQPKGLGLSFFIQFPLLRQIYTKCNRPKILESPLPYSAPSLWSHGVILREAGHCPSGISLKIHGYYYTLWYDSPESIDKNSFNEVVKRPKKKKKSYCALKAL